MENFVLKILEDFLTTKKLQENNLYDRLTHDNDAKYYYEEANLPKKEALRGDVIISFWTPYKRLLEIEADWYAYKSIKSLESLIYQINTKRNTDFSNNIKKINENIQNFAEVCYTKGNYMLLPDRRMNTKRYEISEDRIDVALYECFEDGKLNNFFESKDSLEIWINQQKLNCLFSENIIDKNNIKWFTSKEKLISEMNKEEVYEYLEKAILLIKKRNDIESE